VPVLIPLPDLSPIEVAVPHSSSRDEIRELLAKYLRECDVLELVGTWEEEVFVVREPIAGSIRVEPHHIAVSFDPPMWVPSQREKFQLDLLEWIKTAATTRRVQPYALL
jgi:hypothetical protein